MATGMLDIMKRAALDAVDNAKLADLRFGTVISESPLKIRVTNQFILSEQMLIVPEHLTDYTVKVSMSWDTNEVSNHTHGYSGSTGSGGDPEHTHGYSGSVVAAGSHKHTIASNEQKSLTIHNALKVGDKVALLRKQGGQNYYILDRLVRE